MNDKNAFIAAAGPYLSGRAERFRRGVNTFLATPWLFDHVISDADFEELLQNRTKRNLRYLCSRVLQKMLWFWPRIVDARMWVEAGEGASHRPENFLPFDTASKVLCDAVERYAFGKSDTILDLGCNVGRHLNDLHRRGFTDLTGVDAMKVSLDRLPVEFPEAAPAIKLHHDLFQHFLRVQPDKSFDILYSHGATIELVHPSFAVVRHICRVTKNHVVLILNETGTTAYPRFWNYEFARYGFFLREARRPLGSIPPQGPSDPPSLLVYSRWSEQ